MCWTCIASLPQTIRVGLAKVGNQAKPPKYSLKKVLIGYQLRPDVRTYGHRPQYTADTSTAEIGVCTQKCQAAASSILYRIKWRCVNRVFHVHRIFNSHSSHVWPEANPHAASLLWHQQCFSVVWAGTVLDFLIGPYLLP